MKKRVTTWKRVRFRIETEYYNSMGVKYSKERRPEWVSGYTFDMEWTYVIMWLYDDENIHSYFPKANIEEYEEIETGVATPRFYDRFPRESWMRVDERAPEPTPDPEVKKPLPECQDCTFCVCNERNERFCNFHGWWITSDDNWCCYFIEKGGQDEND